MLKDGIPGGKNDSGDDGKEEITLHENDKLMDNKARFTLSYPYPSLLVSLSIL